LKIFCCNFFLDENGPLGLRWLQKKPYCEAAYKANVASALGEDFEATLTAPAPHSTSYPTILQNLSMLDIRALAGDISR
jgi:hypothetical protein